MENNGKIMVKKEQPEQSKQLTKQEVLNIFKGLMQNSGVTLVKLTPDSIVKNYELPMNYL
jgi:hypothetical protein